MVGKKDEARNALRKAVAISSKGIASTGAFNQIALAIAGTDKPGAAIDWLLNATEIYPNDANLFGTLGDLYDTTGQSERAIESYRKALAIDPALEKAKAGLKKQKQ
ncbi:MAG: tetratricopeptide repeat protein [Pyrinomonadaceae bacterium]